MFTGDYTFANQMGDVCGFGSNIASNNPAIYTVVGEWSGAQTDCNSHLSTHLTLGATWLNGYGIGARYDGTYDGFVGFILKMELTVSHTSDPALPQMYTV